MIVGATAAVAVVVTVTVPPSRMSPVIESAVVAVVSPLHHFILSFVVVVLIDPAATHPSLWSIVSSIVAEVVAPAAVPATGASHIPAVPRFVVAPLEVYDQQGLEFCLLTARLCLQIFPPRTPATPHLVSVVGAGPFLNDYGSALTPLRNHGAGVINPNGAASKV